VFESAVESVNPPVDAVIFGFENVEFLLIDFDAANIDETVDRQQGFAGDITSEQ
jgi:hypothetical protein